jgi:hypothetical protein
MDEPSSGSGFAVLLEGSVSMGVYALGRECTKPLLHICTYFRYTEIVCGRRGPNGLKVGIRLPETKSIVRKATNSP